MLGRSDESRILQEQLDYYHASRRVRPGVLSHRAINRSRVQGQPVEYVQADLFSWTPPRGHFDLVFFGFWLSHVPDARFTAFWALVRGALAPGGAAFFL